MTATPGRSLYAKGARGDPGTILMIEDLWLRCQASSTIIKPRGEERFPWAIASVRRQ